MTTPPTLTCRDLIEFLDDYVAQRLDPATRARFDAHLGACRACRDYLSDYRRTIELSHASFAAADGPGDGHLATSAPSDVVRAVLAALKKQP